MLTSEDRNCLSSYLNAPCPEGLKTATEIFNSHAEWFRELADRFKKVKCRFGPKHDSFRWYWVDLTRHALSLVGTSEALFLTIPEALRVYHSPIHIELIAGQVEERIEDVEMAGIIGTMLRYAYIAGMFHASVPAWVTRFLSWILLLRGVE